jgi:hypothetical protein
MPWGGGKVHPLPLYKEGPLGGENTPIAMCLSFLAATATSLMRRPPLATKLQLSHSRMASQRVA